MTSPWWLSERRRRHCQRGALRACPGKAAGRHWLAVLVPAPLFMAGLGLGAMAGAVASAVAAAGVLIPGHHGPARSSPCGFAAPVAILVRQAMLSRTEDGETEWYPAGLLAATLTIVGLMLAVAIAAAISSLPAQEAFDEHLRMFAENFAAKSDGITAEELLLKMEPAKRCTAGDNDRLLDGDPDGQRGAVPGSAGKVEAEFAALAGLCGNELPNWMAAAAAVTLAAAMLLPDPAGIYALAMAFAASFGFLVQGLAVVHAFNRKIQGGTILLVIFYLLVLGQVGRRCWWCCWARWNSSPDAATDGRKRPIHSAGLRYVRFGFKRTTEFGSAGAGRRRIERWK